MTDAGTKLRGRDAEAYERFRSFAELPMLVVSVAIIPLLGAPLVVELSDEVADALNAIGWGIWSLFVVEYLVLLYLAPDRLQMVRTHVFDLALIVLPFLRPLRVFRSLRALAALGRATVALRSVAGRRGFRSFGLASVSLVVLGGVLTWAFERQHPDASIDSVPDALWWAVVTSTTVGYGDHFPVSSEGRAVAVVLMLVGIGVLGVVTANVAAYFVESDAEDSNAEILERLERIEALLSGGDATDERAPVGGRATGQG